MIDRKEILESIKKGDLSLEEGLELLRSMNKSEGESADNTDQESSIKQDNVSNLIDEWETSDKQLANLEFKNQLSEYIDFFDDDELNNTAAKLKLIKDELQYANENLKEKQSILKELALEAESETLSEDNKQLFNQLKSEVAELNLEIQELHNKKEEIEGGFLDKQEEYRPSEPTLERTKPVKEQTAEAIDQMNERINAMLNRLGGFKNQSVKQTHEANSNITNRQEVDESSAAKTKFDHQFLFKNIAATNIDIKLAKGNVILKTWEDSEISDVRIDTSITLLGKMDEMTPLESFYKRSQIDIDEETILFHVPNKRIQATLLFYLPKRQYDQLTCQLLGGNLKTNDLAIKNVHITLRSGSISLEDLPASLIESSAVEASN